MTAMPRAREIEHSLLFLARRHPARRIAGRAQEDRLGARVAGVEQLVHVEPPARRRGLPVLVQPHEAVFAAHLRRGLEDAGPHRRDDHDVVAGLHHALQGGDHGQRGRARQRDAPCIDLDTQQARIIVAERGAQRADAARAAVEGAAFVQRRLRRLADEGGRDEVGLAQPQRDQVLVAQAERDHDADPVGFEVQDGLADGARLGAHTGPFRGGDGRCQSFLPGRLRASTHIPITPAIPHARVGVGASCPIPVRCPSG